MEELLPDLGTFVTAIYSAILGGVIGGGITLWVASRTTRKLRNRLNHNDRQIAALLADLFTRLTGDDRSVHVDDDGLLRVNVPLQPDDLSHAQSVGELRVAEKSQGEA